MLPRLYCRWPLCQPAEGADDQLLLLRLQLLRQPQVQRCAPGHLHPPVLRLLRGEYRFGGYIHAKAIPGTSPELLEQLGFLADRLSVNIELPSERSLNLLAPDKGRHSIFRPMKQIAVEGAANREEVALYRKAPRFAPAGQSTQMIVGASPETDYHILQAAAAAGASALSGRLAAPLLRVQGRGTSGQGQPQLQPLSGPQVQLGGAALRAVPGGREPRPL